MDLPRRDDPAYMRTYVALREAREPAFIAQRKRHKRNHERRVAAEHAHSRRWRAAKAGADLARLRAAGWTQGRIAAALGVTHETVSRWTTGERIPYARHAEALARLAERLP